MDFAMDGYINMQGNKDKILPYCRIYYESLHLYCTERCAISPEIKFRRQNSGIATDSNLDNCEFKHWTKCQLSLWENALIKKTIFASCSSHEKFDRFKFSSKFFISRLFWGLGNFSFSVARSQEQSRKVATFLLCQLFLFNVPIENNNKWI